MTDTGNSGAALPARDNLRPWRPGQSGNPAGRSRKVVEIETLARGHTEAAIATLARHLDSPDGTMVPSRPVLVR